MVREVEPDDVAEKLAADEDVTVVDIRSPQQYAEGHVPGAVNVPLPELPRRVDEREWDADEVVCVCAIGESSIQAARLLASYEELSAEDVASMAGGYRDWSGELETGRAGAAGDDAAAVDGPDPDAAESDEGPEAPF